MKLRNKKTGEIVELWFNPNIEDLSVALNKRYTSLTELNEEWEDYEEPKTFCTIYYDGKTHFVTDDDNGEDNAFLDKFNEFLEKHCYCCEDIEKSDYYEPKFIPPKNIHETCPENNFEIAYEFYHGDEE